MPDRKMFRVVLEVTESYVLDVYATDEETAIAAANHARCSDYGFDRYLRATEDVTGRVPFTRDDKGEDDADVVAPVPNDGTANHDNLLDEYGL